MIFRRLISGSIIIGVVAGLFLSLMQLVGVTPIILQAETYETETAPSHAHEQNAETLRASLNQHVGGHHHDEDAWSPQDGTERTTYTFVTTILASIGFSAILLALMSQCAMRSMFKLNPQNGVLWGIAGFLTFFLAPGLGLPPEIPGVEAAVLENRQFWWLLAVLATATGLIILAFSPLKIKPVGIIVLLLPYFVGAPQINGPEFAHSDPDVVVALTELHEHFIFVSGLTNLLYWIVSGVLASVVIKYWILKGMPVNAKATA